MATMHHLDAGSLHPVLMGRLANHVIAVELPDGGLALVDTGIGLEARRNPRERLGAVAALAGRPDRDPDGSAVRQLERLGFAAADVRHIVMTHLDYDHAGGLADFPEATVHVHHAELAAATDPPTAAERQRYLEVNWRHGPRWDPFGDGPADRELFGIDGFSLLDGLVVALPLPGHTRGHTGYAIRDGDGWMVHAGDAYYHAAVVDPAAGARQPRTLQVFERVGGVLPGLTAGNHGRLRAIAQDPSVTVVCTHDPSQLAQAQARAAP